MQLNIGPFYIETDSDPTAARELLSQIEQTRWVLGSLLESKDLPSLWPIRIVVTEQGAPSPSFVLVRGQYMLLLRPKSRPPLGELAGLLLDANTPHLPREVESGIRALFSTLEAHGSRVTWGTPPVAPDLDWARMQLFATKFDYGASFHIFLTALKGGSTLAAAERNAFGKTNEILESEARDNLAAGHWQAVAVSGRPLDPRRDFGEHALNDTEASLYVADATLTSEPAAAVAAYKAAVAAGPPLAASGYEGLAEAARVQKRDAAPYWEDAAHAGSRSAPVYVAAADNAYPDQAVALLKKAAELNPLWSEPVYRQAQLAATPAEKEALLKEAVRLEPRRTPFWIELAQLESAAGQATASQGSWLRAEDSAVDDATRDKVHQLRLANEQQRLEAAEAARERDRNAAYQADQQAQESEAARIHAAEEKANSAADAASADGTAPADSAVPWNALTRQVKFAGTLTRVDCLRRGKRLWVKDRTGKSLELLVTNSALKDPAFASSSAALGCGARQVPGHIALQYRATPDDDLHTAGEIVSLQLQ